MLTNACIPKNVQSKSLVHGHKKWSRQYMIKTHLSDPPLPKFEANMRYVLLSPPSSHETVHQKCCCKISYGTTFDLLRPGSNLAMVRHYQQIISRETSKDF